MHSISGGEDLLTLMRTIIRSFRLDLNIERALERVANARGISENAFVSDIIAHAVETEPLDRVFDKRISLSKDIFRSIVGYMRQDFCEIIGYEAAKKDVPVSFELLKMDHNVFSFFHFVKTVLSDSYAWFEIALDSSKGEMLLIHDCGMKWSLFLKGYMSVACESLDLKGEFAVTERLIKISLAMPQNSL